jgi:cytochrome P450
MLIDARIDGGRALTDAELTNLLLTFLFAGHETTISVLGSLTVVVATDLALQERLRQNPSMIAPTVEEVLRLFPPGHSQFRTVTTPTCLHGRDLIAGDKVMLLLAAANRDPEKFDEPDTFDPHRANVRQHVTFGFGSHLCAGHHLARAEIAIFLETMLDRCPPFTLSDDVKFGPFRFGHLLGWDHIPIEFTQ